MTTFYRLFEWLRVVVSYYPRLLLVDLLLTVQYLFASPHRISKRFLKKRGEKEIYAYGETPLTTLDRIVRECRILSKDVVYELGCGTGRTTFWLSLFVKCQAVGIDYLPTYIRRAERVKKLLNLHKSTFLENDMLLADLKRATVIYLYGTCLSDEMIINLIQSFTRLKKGTKIITVSYPLADFCSESLFSIEKEFNVRFPWGRADVFLNIKK